MKRHTGNPKALLCDNLEGWDGEGGLRGRGHVYIYGRFMLMYGRHQHNIVIILQLNRSKKIHIMKRWEVAHLTSREGWRTKRGQIATQSKHAHSAWPCPKPQESAVSKTDLILSSRSSDLCCIRDQETPGTHGWGDGRQFPDISKRRDEEKLCLT